MSESNNMTLLKTSSNSHSNFISQSQEDKNNQNSENVVIKSSEIQRCLTCRRVVNSDIKTCDECKKKMHDRYEKRKLEKAQSYFLKHSELNKELEALENDKNVMYNASTNKITLNQCQYIHNNKQCSFKIIGIFCEKHKRLGQLQIDRNNGIIHCLNAPRGCETIMSKDSKYKTCDTCRNEKKMVQIILCTYAECKFKAKENSKWCGKHTRLGQLIEDKQNGIVHCSNAIRGCESILPKEQTNGKCENCREKERNNTKKAKIERITEHMESAGKQLDTIVCARCSEEKPANGFKTLTGVPSKYCQDCLEKNHEKDRKRAKRDRSEQYKEYAARPETKEKKAKWKEENYDKIVNYWSNYRAKRIEKEGVDEYLRKNAAAAKKYRDENWTNEYREQLNREKRLSIPDKFQTYKRDAAYKSRVFELTLEECEVLFCDKCYYCGESSDINVKLNGIDRKNNDIGYTKENTVSSCETCNMIKGEHNDDTFIKICEHILTNLKIIDGNLYPECFKNYAGMSYQNFIKSLEKRNCTCTISEDQYYDITKNNCYICGKEHSSFHNNGLDRLDNSCRIYSYENVASCCGTCNYLKNSFEWNDILIKLMLVFKNHLSVDSTIQLEINKNTIFPIISAEHHSIQKKEQIINSHLDVIKNRQKNNRADFRLKNLNKYGEEKYKQILAIERKIQRFKKANKDVSELNMEMDQLKSGIETVKSKKEDKKQNAIERKRKQREVLKEKYGNETYKRMNAIQVAINRAKKTNNEQRIRELEKELEMIKSKTTKEDMEKINSLKIKII